MLTADDFDAKKRRIFPGRSFQDPHGYFADLYPVHTATALVTVVMSWFIWLANDHSK